MTFSTVRLPSAPVLTRINIPLFEASVSTPSTVKYLYETGAVVRIEGINVACSAATRF
jgi:hypothetical protein